MTGPHLPPPDYTRNPDGAKAWFKERLQGDGQRKLRPWEAKLSRWLLILLVTAGLVLAARELLWNGCPETADSTYTAADGNLLGGKRGGNVFFYLNFGDEPRVLQANRPEAILLYYDHVTDELPKEIAVQGTNLTTGKRWEFKVSGPHRSTFGPDWKANFVFPEPGCWKLAVDVQSNQGDITVAVKDPDRSDR